MKEQNNIDKLFKAKLGSQDFKPSMEEWSAMSKMLDDKEDKKIRNLPFLWFYTSIGILIAFGFVWFSQEDKIPTAKEQDLDFSPLNLIETNEENINFASIDKSAEISGTKVGESTEIFEKIIANNAIVNEDVVPPLRQPEIVQTSELKISNLVENSKITDTKISAQNNVANDIAEPNIDKVTEPSSLEVVSNENENLILNKTQELAQIEILVAEESNDRVLTSLNQIDVLNTYLQYSLDTKLELPPLDTPNSDYDQFEPYFQMGMGGELLASTSNVSGFKIGLVGDYHISPKLVFNLGINYLQQNNLDIYSKLRLDPIYDFGNAFTIYGIHALKMSSVSVPLSLHYKMGKNQFGGGYEALFNMGVYGDVQEVALMESITRSKVQTVVETVKSGWVDMSAFNNNNGRLFVSYRRQILESLYVGAQGYYQLKHILRAQPIQLEQQSTERMFFGLNVQMFIK